MDVTAMKRVTVFHGNGQTRDYMVRIIMDVVELMETGEYGYVWFRERWILRGNDKDGTGIMHNRYSYILDSNVPEELKMQLMLIQ